MHLEVLAERGERVEERAGALLAVGVALHRRRRPRVGHLGLAGHDERAAHHRLDGRLGRLGRGVRGAGRPHRLAPAVVAVPALGRRVAGAVVSAAASVSSVAVVSSAPLTASSSFLSEQAAATSAKPIAAAAIRRPRRRLSGCVGRTSRSPLPWTVVRDLRHGAWPTLSTRGATASLPSGGVQLDQYSSRRGRADTGVAGRGRRRARRAPRRPRPRRRHRPDGRGQRGAPPAHRAARPSSPSGASPSCARGSTTPSPGRSASAPA